eukprot:gene11059-12227_t
MNRGSGSSRKKPSKSKQKASPKEAQIADSQQITAGDIDKQGIPTANSIADVQNEEGSCKKDVAISDEDQTTSSAATSLSSIEAILKPLRENPQIMASQHAIDFMYSAFSSFMDQVNKRNQQTTEGDVNTQLHDVSNTANVYPSSSTYIPGNIRNEESQKTPKNTTNNKQKDDEEEQNLCSVELESFEIEDDDGIGDDELHTIRPRTPHSHTSTIEMHVASPFTTPYELLSPRQEPKETQVGEEINKRLTDSDLFSQDKDGDTYLHLAISQDKDEVSTKLIKSMATESLDIQNKQGQTPLHLAVHLKNSAMTRQLVNHGASVAVMDSNGDTPLHLACRTKQAELVQCLMHGDSKINTSFGLRTALDMKNYNGEAPLHIAIEDAIATGRDDVFILLLKKHCNINIQESKTGKTSLIMALEKKQYRIAHLLINSGANVNKSTFSGVSPLHIACEFGDLDMINRLIDKHASLYAKNVELQTPKDVAVNDQVKQLLEKALKKNRRKRQKVKQLQQLETKIVKRFAT